MNIEHNYNFLWCVSLGGGVISVYGSFLIGSKNIISTYGHEWK